MEDAICDGEVVFWYYGYDYEQDFHFFSVLLVTVGFHLLHHRINGHFTGLIRFYVAVAGADYLQYGLTLGNCNTVFQGGGRRVLGISTVTIGRVFVYLSAPAQQGAIFIIRVVTRQF